MHCHSFSASEVGLFAGWSIGQPTEEEELLLLPSSSWSTKLAPSSSSSAFKLTRFYLCDFGTSLVLFVEAAAAADVYDQWCHSLSPISSAHTSARLSVCLSVACQMTLDCCVVALPVAAAAVQSAVDWLSPVCRAFASSFASHHHHHRLPFTSTLWFSSDQRETVLLEDAFSFSSTWKLWWKCECQRCLFSLFSVIGAPEVLHATITMAVIGRALFVLLCLRLRNAFEVLVVDNFVVARDHIFCLVLVLVSFHFFFFLLFCFLPRKMSF